MLYTAISGHELAVGEAVRIVEPIDPMVDDPNLTDKKFPRNPTLPHR